MRIAVLLYGRIANFKEHYTHILYTLGKENTLDFFYSCDNEDVSEFTRLYNPIQVVNSPIIYDMDFRKYPGGYDCTNYDSMARHFINKGRVFTLLEEYITRTNTIYDVIFCTRLDIVYREKIRMCPVPDNTLYIPYDICRYSDIWMNDHFAYGSYDAMKKYANIYDTCESILTRGLSIPHPEALTYANLNWHGVAVHRWHIPYDIERSPYTTERPPYCKY